MASPSLSSRGSNGPYSNNSASSDFSQISPANSLTSPEIQQQQLLHQQALQHQRGAASQGMSGEENIFHFPGQPKGR